MAINTKSRNDLKSYFVKNAIPTEKNFADLIDAQLNQADDGVFKTADQPLSVVAASGAQKRVLRFYGDSAAANPEWLINLKPAQEPSNEATVRPGFGIADGTGKTRLFIDPTTGNLGLGTNDPKGAIDVRIGGSNDLWHRFVVTTTPAWGTPNTQHVVIGAGGASGIMFSNPHVTWLEKDSRASIRYGRTGSRADGTWWDVGVRTDGGFSFSANDGGGAGADLVKISKEGIFTATKGADLKQPDWSFPTLLNNWVNYGGSYNGAAYFKDSCDIVHLRGLIKAGVGDVPGETTLFTLPAGFRPPSRQLHVVCTHPNAAGRVDVLTDGRVNVLEGKLNWISLDGISFRAA
jgi:hypothetical protein